MAWSWPGVNKLFVCRLQPRSRRRRLRPSSPVRPSWQTSVAAGSDETVVRHSPSHDGFSAETATRGVGDRHSGNVKFALLLRALGAYTIFIQYTMRGIPCY